jgi:hypothetical protein
MSLSWWERVSKHQATLGSPNAAASAAAPRVRHPDPSLLAEARAAMIREVARLAVAAGVTKPAPADRAAPVCARAPRPVAAAALAPLAAGSAAKA